MKKTGKPKRTYNSSRRRAQARETRRTIVAAARLLFIERGYSGATIEAIAQESGVAPETIYAIFGSKRSLLESVIATSVGGDDEPIPLLERPGPQNVLGEQDPQKQLRLFAKDIAMILERVAPDFEVMRLAAKTEPDIADLLDSILSERLQTMEIFAGRIAERGALREGLHAAAAAETIWTLSSPEVYRLLTVDRGWTGEQYIQWLGDALIRLLLPQ